jgi:hypothetical protein
MTTEQLCIDCKSAPATMGRFCGPCVQRTAREECVKAGMPPEGRDPAVVSREIRIRRAAAALLLGRLTGDDQRQADAMRVVLMECAPGVKPADLLVPPLLNLATYVAPWRIQFVETLREVAAVAAAEAEIADDDTEHVRNCLATEATADIMRGRLTGAAGLQADAWARAETLAERQHTTASRLLMGPVMGLLNDRVHGAAREHLVDRVTFELMLYAGPAPDTLEGLDVD